MSASWRTWPDRKKWLSTCVIYWSRKPSSEDLQSDHFTSAALGVVLLLPRILCFSYSSPLYSDRSCFKGKAHTGLSTIRGLRRSLGVSSPADKRGYRTDDVLVVRSLSQRSWRAIIYLTVAESTSQSGWQTQSSEPCLPSTVSLPCHNPWGAQAALTGPLWCSCGTRTDERPTQTNLKCWLLCLLWIKVLCLWPKCLLRA